MYETAVPALLISQRLNGCIVCSLPPPPPSPSAFRVRTYIYVTRAKVTVSRRFFQCHVIQDKHTSCGCDYVTFLLAVSENFTVGDVRLRRIHVNINLCLLLPYLKMVNFNNLVDGRLFS